MSVSFNGDSRFDVTWKYGRAGEVLVGELCRLTDSGEVRIEVKRKRYSDSKFYVELEHDPGRRGEFAPSGLSVTGAEVWAFAIADSGVVLMVRTEHLRTAVQRNYGFPAKETDGTCPTRGRLLHWLDVLQASKPGPPSRANFGDDFHVLF